MRKKIIIKKAISYSPAILVIVFAIVIFSNLIRWPPDQIRAYMLKRMPVGTNMEDAIKIIEKNKKWKIVTISNNGGYLLRQGRNPEYASPDDIASGRTIGKQTIIVDLGEYRYIFSVGADAFWGFDENSRLVDLHVRKYVDAP